MRDPVNRPSTQCDEYGAIESGNGYIWKKYQAQIGEDGGKASCWGWYLLEARNLRKSYPREKGRVGKRNCMWTDWTERGWRNEWPLWLKPVVRVYHQMTWTTLQTSFPYDCLKRLCFWKCAQGQQLFPLPPRLLSLCPDTPLGSERKSMWLKIKVWERYGE